MDRLKFVLGHKGILQQINETKSSGTSSIESKQFLKNVRENAGNIFRDNTVSFKSTLSNVLTLMLYLANAILLSLRILLFRSEPIRLLNNEEIKEKRESNRMDYKRRGIEKSED
ncbi:hypothetical protein K0M31_002180 [Melipona bicolor]|uniref:Uncharacterized protein n=1 Tax=Melipona bicolor TaxID=60889 RepID=A0AA40GH11_9HYME|nr:hypothetical protein K0M31_002180 [Melipona bicolor]